MLQVPPGGRVEVDDVEAGAARAVLHPRPRDPDRRGQDLAVVALDRGVLGDDPQVDVGAQDRTRPPHRQAPPWGGTGGPCRRSRRPAGGPRGGGRRRVVAAGAASPARRAPTTSGGGGWRPRPRSTPAAGRRPRAHHLLVPGGSRPQPGLRLVGHPAERDVGQPVVRVLATDVAVHAREPDLLQASGTLGDLLGVEPVDRVRAPVLVEGDREPTGCHVGHVAGERPVRLLELGLRVEPADGLHGVPETEEGQVVGETLEVRVAELSSEARRWAQNFFSSASVQVARGVPRVELHRVGHEVLRARAQQADGAQHAGQRRARCRRHG